MHATNNLIELLREDDAHFASHARCFWNVDVDIRPLDCIVRCLAHWLKLGRRDLMATYTLYLERDIKICARKRDFADTLESEFGWVAKMEKFDETLTWTQMERLYAVLAALEGDKTGKGKSTNIMTGALVAGSVALSVAMVALFRSRHSSRERAV